MKIYLLLFAFVFRWFSDFPLVSRWYFVCCSVCERMFVCLWLSMERFIRKACAVVRIAHFATLQWEKYSRKSVDMDDSTRWISKFVWILLSCEMWKGSFNQPASQPTATVRKESEWCRHMGKHVHEKFVHHWCHIEWAVLFVCKCVCLPCMCRRCCCRWWWTTCCSLSILFLVRTNGRKALSMLNIVRNSRTTAAALKSVALPQPHIHKTQWNHFRLH